MEFLVTSLEERKFTNKNLQHATDKIFKLGETMKKNWFCIAAIIANVDETECYKDDGFGTVHSWVESTFGIKKTASYTLLSIGKEYTQEITDKLGKVIGYRTNLIESGDDFSKTQIEKMLPLGHDTVVDLVESGEITPDMTVKEISEVVKKYKTGNDADESETEDGNKTEDGNESEDDECVFVRVVADDIKIDGEMPFNVYHIPYAILIRYLDKDNLYSKSRGIFPRVGDEYPVG